VQDMDELGEHVRCIAGQFDLLALHATNPKRYPALLESVTRGGTARYSILFAFPQASLCLSASGQLSYAGQSLKGGRFFPALDALWKEQSSVESGPKSLPFRGGWLFYLGYEVASEIEPKLMVDFPPVFELPHAVATRIPAAVIVDHQQDCTTVFTEPGYSAYFAELMADIDALPVVEASPFSASDVASPEQDDPETYLSGVRRVKRYICDGDVFQVNLSRGWQDHTKKSAVQLYRDLKSANPAPFAALFNWAGKAIISSSPERLVKVTGGVAETRPIAGTRPRAIHADDDSGLLDELLAHPKERAEHIMLVDLERNDLGRVCEFGSIEVNEMMVVESYAHVHHIVSNIRGTLRADVTPGEVLQAVFPGGTITGCPKVRCMEIIAELEQTARGPYTGSIGYLNHNGDMDSNILIRTIVYRDGELSFRAGAGIVSDSEPEKELAETRSKAKGLCRALV